MASPFRYHKEAKIEFFEAVTWYEEKSLGKGQDFADDFTNTLYKILANPETYRKVQGEYRRIHFDKFPYYVIYKQRPKTIHIIAIFHNKRNDTWKKRLY